MARDVVIVDARGRRTATRADFPLSVGGAASADIRVPGLDGEDAAAYIGIADEHLFVQPADGAASVHHNEEPLEGSRWLAHGDVLRFGATRVSIALGAASVTFSVDAPPGAPDLRPPVEPPPAELPPSPARPARARAGRPRRRHARAWSWLALGVFCVLAAAAGFVFFATPVSLRIEPAPEASSVSGRIPGVEVAGRLLLLPGTYRLRATRDGYRPLDERFEVASGPHRELHFPLEKLPGIVNVETRPIDGARVVVDGELRGRTPLEGLELSPGTHAVRVEAERYAPASLDLDVEGLGKEQTVALELVPRWAQVSIDSRPPGARVRLDGELVGVTPLDIEPLEGTYRLALELEDHDALTTELTVVANRPQTLPTFELVESDGTLRIESRPPGATVSVDGTFHGTTPLDVALAPRREHELRLSKPGYETQTRRVRVEPAGEEALSVRLEPRYGAIFITAIPADAELYVDGERRGPATGRIELTTSAHRLEIRKDGYQTHRATVTPRAGVTQELAVALVPAAEAKAAALEERLTTSEGQVLRLVRPARFRMGASRREQGRRANESRRLVELTRPYYIGVKEVTNAEFRRFRPAHGSGSAEGRSLDDPRHPVARVSWEDAVQYLNWLSAKESLPPAYEKRGETYVPVSPATRGYRLPTEAEWAFAARYAGDAASPARKYPWGGTFPPPGAAGNYADASASGLLPNTIAGYTDSFPVSAPVGSFPGNRLGIHDLGGNVAEWCQDYYAVYPGAAEVLVTDPLGPATGRHHVVRGSSWRDASISELRSSYRDYSDKSRPDLGFRIARYAD